MLAELILNSSYLTRIDFITLPMDKIKIKDYLDLLKDKFKLCDNFLLDEECYWISLKERIIYSGNRKLINEVFKNKTFMYINDLFFLETGRLNQIYNLCLNICDIRDSCNKDCYNCEKLIQNKRLLYVGDDFIYGFIKDWFKSESFQEYYSEEFFNEYFQIKKLIDDYNKLNI